MRGQDEADVEVHIQEVNVEATSQGHVVGQAEVEAQDVAATKEDALSLSTAKSVIHQAVTKQKSIRASGIQRALKERQRATSKKCKEGCK